MDDHRIEEIAAEAFRTLGTGAQIASFSARHPSFTLSDAYRVSAVVRGMREARGERVIGRKIGFTNRTMWVEHGVHAPIWGYVYDSTVHDVESVHGPVPLAGFAEPRIEPEIVFGLKSMPGPGLDDEALLAHVAWVAHGLEIVQSLFPGWRFSPADTVAAFGLHGALLVGPRLAVDGDRTSLARDLATFTITLERNGEVADRGGGASVLDSPLAALRHLIGVLAADRDSPPLEAGEIVSTGTLTRALPIAPGETWSTSLQGLPLPGLTATFA